MTERWFFSVDCAESGIRRIESPWRVDRVSLQAYLATLPGAAQKR